MEKDHIIELFSAIEKQVQNLQYGTISGNVLISKGIPVSQTLNLVLSKRKRYRVDNSQEKDIE